MDIKINKGYLCKTKNKKSDKSPDYTGGITLEDGNHWLSAWANESRAGKKYLSISIGELKDEQPRQGSVSNASAEDFYDDVPF